MNRRERRDVARRGGQVIGLAYETAWCDRHLAPIQGEPPAVGLAAMGHLLSAFLADPRIQRETGGGQLLECGAAVERHQPLCCFLGDDLVREIRDRAVLEGR